ncbi:MAG: Glucans biosynthesis protein [Planctomycetota bacterium]
MLLGILLHGAMAFMPFPWVVQDTQKTPAAGLIVGVIHGFRMPLFFLMSGFFTAMLWQKRGAVSMLQQRLLRVLVPCMLGLVTLLPAGEWVAARSREIVAQQNGAGPSADPWAAHLARAVTAGDPQRVAGLLAEEDEADGPRPPLVDPASKSPLLTTAAVLGHVEVVRELLDHGAEIDARDQGGRTAMHAAAFMGKADVVELLLARGAEPLPKGPVGDTPIDASKVDGTTTTMLAGVLGLPAPNMDEVEVGRRRVRQLLLAAMGKPDPEALAEVDDKGARQGRLLTPSQARSAGRGSLACGRPTPAGSPPTVLCCHCHRGACRKTFSSAACSTTSGFFGFSAGWSWGLRRWLGWPPCSGCRCRHGGWWSRRRCFSGSCR